MGGFFNFGLLDIWNHPVLQITRAGAKLAAKGFASANAKAQNGEITTSEMLEIINQAKKGDSNAQCALALYFIEKQDYSMATYWLKKSANQGNEYALEILNMMQEG